MWQPAPEAEAQARLCDSHVLVHNWGGSMLKQGLCFCLIFCHARMKRQYSQQSPHTQHLIQNNRSVCLISAFRASECLRAGTRRKQTFRHCQFCICVCHASIDCLQRKAWNFDTPHIHLGLGFKVDALHTVTI